MDTQQLTLERWELEYLNSCFPTSDNWIEDPNVMQLKKKLEAALKAARSAELPT